MNSWIRHIITILYFSALWMPAQAQEPQSEVLMPGEKPKPTKYVAIEEEKKHLVFFQGFTLSVDLYGPAAYAIGDYGTLEAALRLNLKNTFFPIFEAGFGRCKKDDFNTKVEYEVNAPFARVGLDINMLKDKFQHNRLYLGARYGFSSYKYDVSGPQMTDPIWGGSEAFSMKGIDCTSHWAELIFGVEVSIYKNFHMGWAVRYKREISSTKNDNARPSCIPGYGYTTNTTCWGGTYSLIFDLNWGLKKSHKRGINMEIRDVPQHTEAPHNAETNGLNQPDEHGEGNDTNDGTTEDTTESESDGEEPETTEGNEAEAL